MLRPSRREFTAVAAGAGVSLVAGCGPKSITENCPRIAPRAPWSWLPAEQEILAAGGDQLAIVVRSGPGSEVLRSRAREAPAELDFVQVARKMERAMEAAGGVGIAGPQVGLSLRIATLKLDYKTDHPYNLFVSNPLIIERSEEAVEGYEGCLSIPGVGGLVRRNRIITVEYTDLAGERARHQATDHNAVLWQHELDHLDGVLYVDRLLGELLPMEEVRRLRREAEQKTAVEPFRPSARGDALEGAPVLVASFRTGGLAL